jgi:hypothetical protein
MSTQAIATLAVGDYEVRGWYNQNTTGGSHSVQGCTDPYYIQPVWWNNIYPYWPIYPSIQTTQFVVEDKTKKAFALAKKLVKTKWMAPSKISEFIELVEMIEKEL